jgi:hypothetical protein
VGDWKEIIPLGSLNFCVKEGDPEIKEHCMEIAL